MWTPTEKQQKMIDNAQKNGKEFYYVGHYVDNMGNYILKPGTTNNLQRRYAEHNRAYKRTPNHPMKEGTTFEYNWFIPLSKYNTLRIEDKVKNLFRAEGFGSYQNNDRFVFTTKPQSIKIKIRKTYEIVL